MAAGNSPKGAGSLDNVEFINSEMGVLALTGTVCYTQPRSHLVSHRSWSGGFSTFSKAYSWNYVFNHLSFCGFGSPACALDQHTGAGELPKVRRPPSPSVP